METQHNYKIQPTPPEQLSQAQKVEKVRKLTTEISDKNLELQQIEAEKAKLYQDREKIIESLPIEQQKRLIIEIFSLD